MRSSISSSESTDAAGLVADPASEATARLPAGGWGRCWLLALLLSGSCLGSLEAFLRERGRVASIDPDKNLWCVQRDLVADDNPNAVAVLGTSRTLTGFDSRLFRREYPEIPLAMLDVRGTHPAATLEDLANNTKFRGLVLCELFSCSLVPGIWNSQKSYVDYYHDRWSTNQRVDRFLKTLVQRSLVSVTPGWRRDLAAVPIHWLQYMIGRRATPMPAWKAQPRVHSLDGSMAINYEVVDPMVAQEVLLNYMKSFMPDFKPISDKEWADIVARLAAIIAKIQDRGGRVVLINYPIVGPIKEVADLQFPRDRYWDVLARGTKAIAIDVEDVPSLSGFRPPDGLHLGREDTERFTASLLEELRRRQILPSLTRR